MTDRRRSGWIRLVLAATAVLVLAACTHSSKGDPVTALSAKDALAQGEQVVADLAAAVAPGSAVSDSAVMAGPDPCSAPQTGKVYYTIFKQFDAAQGAVGATLQSVIADHLRAGGFELSPPTTSGDWPTLRGGTHYIGISVQMSPTSPLVKVSLDTECGTPGTAG